MTIVPILMVLLYVVFYGLLIGLHIVLAIAVHRDALQLERAGDRLLFIGPGAWTVATLLFGIVSALIYWLMHYSTLSMKQTGT